MADEAENETPETEGQEPEENPTPEAPQLSPEDMQREMEKARKEAANYRTRLRKFEKEAEDRAKAEMSEAEQAKAAAAAAEERAKARERRIVQAEAKAAAAAQGVKPERLAYVLRLADLEGVAVDEQGEPDGKAISAAIAAVLKELPELKGATNVGGPTNPGADGHKGPNPWAKDTLNLTEQARLLREDPALAKQLKEAAGRQ